MAVNLKKNKASLEKAWEEIHDPKGKNNWVIFGYEGQTSDLKIVSQGEDGIEEMVDDLNGGKILYAGLRVIDPNTNLPKIVFINWQGEGVPATVKGKCANHLRDITGFFRGMHVQINARNDDDVDEEVIMEKVKNASGANYSIHKEKPKVFVPQGKIGSVYERKRPDQEIDTASKNKFWAQQEKEEKKRKEEEHKRVQEERIKESRERAEREKREAEKREMMIRERSKSIDQQRRQSLREEEKQKEEERRRYEQTLKEARKDDDEFRKRADSDRRRRLHEANQLIRKRQESFEGTSPRDAFEKPPPPTTAKRAVPLPPSSKPKKAVVPPPVQPPRQPSPPPVRQPSPPPVREPTPPPVRDPSPPPPRQPSPPPVRQPTPPPVRELTPPPVREPTPPPVREPTPPPVREPSPEIPPSRELPPEPPMENAEPEVFHQSDPSLGITAKAMYDYQGVDDTEISFDPGDIITHIEKVDEGWWRGRTSNGYIGLFPANYVEEIFNESPQPPQVVPQLPATPQEDHGLRAKTIYDYQAEDDSEISFDVDEIITNIEQIDPGWWRGTAPDGSYGLFPANYVELI